MNARCLLVVALAAGCGPSWRPVDPVTAPAGAQWAEVKPGTVDPAALLERWEVAVVLLEVSPVVADSARIYVQPTPTYIDPWGRRVAGLMLDPYLEVGSDLAALAHELAHLRDARAGLPDANAHDRWLTDSTRAALDVYDTLFNTPPKEP